MQVAGTSGLRKKAKGFAPPRYLGSFVPSVISQAAHAFFEACETGKGWAGCEPYCHADATFAAQSEPLLEITRLDAYADWMKGLLKVMPDGACNVRSFAVDQARHNVCACGVFTGTHTGEGGPCPPTGKRVSSDYVYSMDFEDGKIRHMTKVWHSLIAMQQLGWA